MKVIDIDHQKKLSIITLNRSHKRNAFDDEMLLRLQEAIEEASSNNQTSVILLNAIGQDFCVGADLTWMQRVAGFSFDENFADAMILARLMKTFFDCPKPTVVAVKGATFGGGLGLVAAADIALATKTSKFCFSEVKLGLIPAIISPYIIRAIGERVALSLFLSADLFDAERAKELQLIHHLMEDENYELRSLEYAHKLSNLAPESLVACKKLSKQISNLPIDESILEKTAIALAHKRVSKEGQHGLSAFLSKTKPMWDKD